MGFIENAQSRINKIKLSRTVRKIIIFAITVLQYLEYRVFDIGSPSKNDWQTTELAISYQYGFIRRGVLGSIVNGLFKIFPNTSTYDIVAAFHFASMLIFVVAMLLFLFYFIDKTYDTPYRNPVFSCILLFMSLGGLSFYFYDWAEADVIIIALSLLAILSIISGKCLFVIPVCCALSTMIHEGYPMMFFGIVFFLLLLKWYQAPKGHKAPYFICAFVSGLVTSILFVYFYFFSGLKAGITYDQVYMNALKMTPEPLMYNLDTILYRSGEQVSSLFNPNDKDPFLIKAYMTVAYTLICTPVLLMIFLVMASILKQAKATLEKLIYIALFASVLLVVPLFLIHSDIGRWAYDILFHYFMVFAVLMLDKNEHLTNAIEDFCKDKKKYVFAALPFVYFFLIVHNKLNIITLFIQD